MPIQRSLSLYFYLLYLPLNSSEEMTRSVTRFHSMTVDDQWRKPLRAYKKAIGHHFEHLVT